MACVRRGQTEGRPGRVGFVAAAMALGAALVLLGVGPAHGGALAPPSCRKDADCKGGEICAGSLCVRARDLIGRHCKRDTDCKGGEMCMDGGCVAARDVLLRRGCRGDGDCPKGRRCDAGQCVKPTRRTGAVRSGGASAKPTEPTFAARDAFNPAVEWSAAPGLYVDMVRLSGGEFTMGGPGGKPDELPPRRVTVSPFFIDRTEVTAAAFLRCVAAGACSAANYSPAGDRPYCNIGDSSRGNHPANCVDWHGASAYCQWAGKRLPTEAEWEFAARGTEGRTFPWGESDPSCAVTIMENEVNDGCGDDHTFAVASRPSGATPEGVFDLIGNVWEWVSDWYSETAYATGAVVDPTGPATGTRRVMRGASWLAQDRSVLRAANRDHDELDYIGNGVGFRCALSE